MPRRPTTDRPPDLPAPLAPTVQVREAWMAPASVEDLFLYQLTQLSTSARVPVVRLCEQRHGITRREWRLLALMAEQPGLSPSALAARADLDRARTSRVLTGLIAKGLVQRQPGPADRREAQLHLSTRGAAVVRDLWPQVAAVNRALLSALAPDERARLADMLARLKRQADALAAEAAGRGAGGCLVAPEDEG